MRFSKAPRQSAVRFAINATRPFRNSNMWRTTICLAAFGSLALAVWPLQQTATPDKTAPGTSVPPNAATQSNEPANAQMPAKEQQQIQEGAPTEQPKKVADEVSDLLKLATDLRTEVDKTSEGALSVAVIRKADEVEKLSHELRDKKKNIASGK